MRTITNTSAVCGQLVLDTIELPCSRSYINVTSFTARVDIMPARVPSLFSPDLVDNGKPEAARDLQAVLMKSLSLSSPYEVPEFLFSHYGHAAFGNCRWVRSCLPKIETERSSSVKRELWPNYFGLLIPA